MTHPMIHQPDPRLDLVFERIVNIPRGLIWTAWTTPEHLKKWLTPAPWTTVDCEIDLRPGGIFRTVMRSPEGQEFPNVGCYLEIVKNEKLVWTNALAPGYRPAKPSAAMPCDTFSFAAVLSLEPHANGTSTLPSSCTAMKRPARNTRRWDSKRVGERLSISSLPSSGKCERVVTVEPAGGTEVGHQETWRQRRIVRRERRVTDPEPAARVCSQWVQSSALWKALPELPLASTRSGVRSGFLTGHRREFQSKGSFSVSRMGTPDPKLSSNFLDSGRSVMVIQVL